MQYYPRLDGLRFVAIGLVLFHHFAGYLGERFYAAQYGVALFFVISGFLITNILINLKGENFGKNYFRFIGRRTLRIFPIYYFTVLLLYCLGAPAIQENLVYLVTYTFNYGIILTNLHNSPFGHFWSLSVEEQFYFAWPLLIITCRKNITALLLVTSLPIIIGYGQTIFHFLPISKTYDYYGIVTRMAGLGLGGLGAILLKNDWLPKELFGRKIFEVYGYVS